jgi:vacuolar-type H+-ATPase subunit I/STV1
MYIFYIVNKIINLLECHAMINIAKYEEVNHGVVVVVVVVVVFAFFVSGKKDQ